MHLQRRREHTALDFHTSKLEQDAIESWRARLHHLKSTEAWAKDAEFYFVIKRVIKRWHTAAVASAKQRRQDAYAQIRRMVKMNLARRCLSQWRAQAQGTEQTMESARTTYGNRISRLGGDIFDRWRLLTSTRLQSLDDANAQYRRETMSQSLRVWIAAGRSIHDMTHKAIRYYEIHISEITATQLRKQSLRIFDVRRREQDADAIRDRNQRKHVRNMFRHWLGKARISRGITDAIEPSEGNVELVDEAGDATQQAEDWTALEQDLDLADWIPPLEEPLATATPQPGYLNTPSKRAVRAKALANLSLTTPVTPWRMPLANRLQSARSSVQQRVYAPASGLGRSLLGSIRNVESEDEVGSPSPRLSGNAV